MTSPINLSDIPRYVIQLIDDELADRDALHFAASCRAVRTHCAGVAEEDSRTISELLRSGSAFRAACRARASPASTIDYEELIDLLSRPAAAESACRSGVIIDCLTQPIPWGYLRAAVYPVGTLAKLARQRRIAWDADPNGVSDPGSALPLENVLRYFSGAGARPMGDMGDAVEVLISYFDGDLRRLIDRLSQLADQRNDYALDCLDAILEHPSVAEMLRVMPLGRDLGPEDEVGILLDRLNPPTIGRATDDGLHLIIVALDRIGRTDEIGPCIAATLARMPRPMDSMQQHRRNIVVRHATYVFNHTLLCDKTSLPYRIWTDPKWIVDIARMSDANTRCEIEEELQIRHGTTLADYP